MNKNYSIVTRLFYLDRGDPSVEKCPEQSWLNSDTFSSVFRQPEYFCGSYYQIVSFDLERIELMLHSAYNPDVAPFPVPIYGALSVLVMFPQPNVATRWYLLSCFRCRQICYQTIVNIST